MSQVLIFKERNLLENKIKELEKTLHQVNVFSKSDIVLQIGKETKKGLMEIYFEDKIIENQGKRTKTVDVFKDVNNYFQNINIKFSKFEVTNFMISKNLDKRKVGGTNYYYNVKIRE